MWGVDSASYPAKKDKKKRRTVSDECFLNYGFSLVSVGQKIGGVRTKVLIKFENLIIKKA